MGKKYSEQMALQKLGISDFNYMTQEKLTDFSSMMPYMDPEASKKALAKFPNFKDMQMGLVNIYKLTIDKILERDADSEHRFYNACDEILSCLKDELKHDNISSDERDKIENKIIKVAKMIGEKDSEGKIFKTVLTILAGIGIATLALFLAEGLKYLMDSISEVSENNDSNVDIDFEDVLYSDFGIDCNSEEICMPEFDDID